MFNGFHGNRLWELCSAIWISSDGADWQQLSRGQSQHTPEQLLEVHKAQPNLFQTHQIETFAALQTVGFILISAPYNHINNRSHLPRQMLHPFKVKRLTNAAWLTTEALFWLLQEWRFFGFQCHNFFPRLTNINFKKNKTEILMHLNSIAKGTHSTLPLCWSW